MAAFERGDIIRVNLESVIGHEMRGGSRPALVLTSSSFNRLGDVLVAPITQGGDYARFAGFAVSSMGTGCKTQGVAVVNVGPANTPGAHPGSGARVLRQNRTTRRLLRQMQRTHRR